MATFLASINLFLQKFHDFEAPRALRGPKINEKTLKNQGFSTFFKDPHFSTFLDFYSHFYLIFSKKPPILAPGRSQRDSIGILRPLLGASWGSFLSLWTPLATLLDLSWGLSAPFSSILEPQEPPRMVFTPFFNESSTRIQMIFSMISIDSVTFMYIKSRRRASNKNVTNKTKQNK